MVDRVARPAAAWQGHRLLDTRCSIATAACCAPMPPAKAAGGCRRGLPMSIRVSSTCCSPTRTSASRSHHGVDPLALARAAFQLVSSGQIRSGGSTLTMQVARLLEPRSGRSLAGQAPPGRARRRDRARARARTRCSRSISISRRMAAISKAFVPRRWPISARSRAGFRLARRRSGRAAAIAGSAPAGPLGRSRARGEGPRARPLCRDRAACLPTRSRSPKPSRCRPAAAPCRCWRRMPPTAPSPKRRRGAKFG